MANVSISQLPNLAGLVNPTDIFLMSRPNDPVVGGFTSLQVTGAQISAGLSLQPTIIGGSINNTPIGNITPSTGAFTALSATGALNVTGSSSFTGAVVTQNLTVQGALNVTGSSVFPGGINNTPIGNTTPSTGVFTTLVVNGTSTVTLAAGVLAHQGLSTAPTFGANGEGAEWLTLTGGLNIGGKGSVADLTVQNSAGASVFTVPTGTVNTLASGTAIFNPPSVVVNPTAGQMLVFGGGAFPTFTANGSGAIWPTTTGGLVWQGQGSVSDLTAANSAGATVFSVPTGTVNSIWPGFMLFNAPATVPTMGAGQVAVFGQGANPTFTGNGQAAFWSTTAGGAVVQGQGSVSDGNWLNSLGASYLSNPTGTVNTIWPGVALFNIPPSIPAIGAGQLAVFGALALPAGALTSAGQGAVWSNPVSGLNLRGFGTAGNPDLVLQNGLGQAAFTIPFQSITPQVPAGLTLTPHAAVATLGTVWEDSTQQTLAAFEGNSTANGLTSYKTGVVYSATGSVVTSGTVAVSLLSVPQIGTANLPANFLVIGKTFRIKLSGTVVTSATPGTLTIEGGVGVGAAFSAALTLSASAGPVQFEITIDATCRTTGTTGTVIAIGRFSTQQSIGGVGITQSSTAINTTVPNAFSIASINSVSGGTVLTVLTATIEILA